MVKILSYVEAEGMLRVTTDNPGRWEFVYPVGRYITLAQLQAEIDRSVASEQARAAKSKAKSDLVKMGLDLEVSKNAGK